MASTEHGDDEEEGGGNDESLRIPPVSHRSQYTKMGSAWDMPPLSPDELDAMMASFTRQDDFSKKTLSRSIVESTLQNYKWYFPKRDVENGPSLSKAWAYFEHITLARHFVGEGSTDHKLQRAEPGETSTDTELYSPWTTPESSLNEWGIGVGLYFSTLRAMSLIIFLAGLINVANIYYYHSGEYSGSDGQSDLVFTLKGSAICTDREWSVCTDCNVEDWGSDEDEGRYAKSVVDGTTYVKRTLCLGAELAQGMVNWATLLFLFLCLGLLALYQRKREVRFDEDKSTSTDYSIIVSNPPSDAYDPEEWRAFFEQFSDDGQVTFCTIALNNDKLLRTLIRRRIFRNRLRMQLPKGVDFEDEDALRQAAAQVMHERSTEQRTCLGLICYPFWRCLVVPVLRLFNRALPLDVLVDKIFTATDEAKELQQKKYDVTKVFVTFETEAGQRLALEALDASKLDVIRNNTHKVSPSALFRGRILRVHEPTEPNTVRWLDLDVGVNRKRIQRLVTFMVTLGMIAFSGFIINRVRDQRGPFASGILISVFNFIIPPIVRLIMMVESHATEGGRQTSLYLKVTLFRWTNTAIITLIITPFTSSISDGSRALLPTINVVLLSELVVAPLLRYLDLMGFLRKHVWAPRARNQEEMNLSFTGTPYNLAERYTDFTKVLFLCFFYCSLFPAAFFICALTLLVQYYTDKFCLMRVWASAPFIGTQLAKFSRRYFFSSALVALGVVSSYHWAQFPYDNVCGTNSNANPNNLGTQQVIFQNGTTSIIDVTQEEVVEYCNQNIWSNGGFVFPAVPGIQKDDWMTNSQERLTRIYGWTSVGVLAAFVWLVFGGSLMAAFFSFFRPMYKPEGIDQKIDFSTLQEIFAYVPQIKIGGFGFPFLACDVDDIDTNLIGWTDRHRSYDYHNLIFDVPHPGMKRPRRKEEESSTREEGETEEEKAGGGGGERFKDDIAGGGGDATTTTTVSSDPIFSLVKHWPPEWYIKEREQQEQEQE